ncbi:hypothetical protein THRCLA_05419 [Thraustotheca clavata]|uniref:Uncharacterized protein n=1 Tax=Thraustotheca clavata TaxID=74557 RepID=A0A1V9ZW00_9STRA|nr:hypothetical protein THRCLA_05419 [Thraustotheca clavata]
MSSTTVEWKLSPPSIVCPFDPVEIQVNWSLNMTYEPNVQIFASAIDAKTKMAAIDSKKKLNMMRISDNYDPDVILPPIYCEVDEKCQLKVTTLVIPNRPDGNLIDGDILEISFSHATNEPSVGTKEDLEEILDFPNDFGQSLTGKWITSQLLQIKIISIAHEVKIRDITQSPIVKEFILPQLPIQTWSYQSNIFRYRIGIEGHFQIVLRFESESFNETLYHHTSDTITVSGVDCPDANVITSLSFEDEKIREPIYSVNGILSFDGHRSAILPHSTIPMTKPAWSLVFWLYLSQDSTGEYRTLFYKGPGSNQHRTPSAWLQPHDRKLIVRVSTLDNMDIGFTSNSELPLHQWTLLSFSFQNLSSSQDIVYEISLSINGHLDSQLKLHNTTVLPNDGNFYIGDNPWMDGIQGFVAKLKLYDTYISEEDCFKIFVRENSNFPTETLPSTLVQYLKPVASTALVSLSVGLDEFKSNGNLDATMEAADYGDTKAMIEAGRSLMHGEIWNSDKFVPCVQNTSLGAMYLRRALELGNWYAAKPLGILLSPTNPEDSIVMYHIAAMMGDYTAMTILAHKYANDDNGIEKDIETAVHYYHWSATDASRTYHIRGEEPLHEMNSLFYADQINVREGQDGEDDKLIQYQKMKADVDQDPEAMTNMGDLYYWGARGCPRDHELAYNYFNRAAQLGHVTAMSAVAGMLLKGEGVAQNNASAIAWYEEAAKFNNVRALNGLGYIYFYGTANCTQNQTKGLEYFKRAAAQESDGDSLFNVGYCHFNGLGTVVNHTHGVSFYDKAARQFGHFDAVFEMAKYHLNAHNSPTDFRSPHNALPYLQAASAAGSWGKGVRKGFEHFLNDQPMSAVWYYHEALELGYPVAAGNLAYLYGVLGQNNSKYLMQATEIEATLMLGDCYYYGKCGVEKDTKKALVYYNQASSHGLSVGAYNLGFIYEHGVDGVAKNPERAQRYYQRALELSPSLETYFVVYISKLRLALWDYSGDKEENYSTFESIDSIALTNSLFWCAKVLLCFMLVGGTTFLWCRRNA